MRCSLLRYVRLFKLMIFSRVYHFFRFLWRGCLLFSLSSCSPHILNIQTQYFNQKSLASYYIGTPDPSLKNPMIGQKLLVQWSLKTSCIEDSPLFLYLKLRFRNHEEKEIVLQIHRKKGIYVYELKGEEFCETGGVLTYMGEIRNDETCIASWKHPLWVNFLSFKS